jgi:hypothetical protein
MFYPEITPSAKVQEDSREDYLAIPCKVRSTHQENSRLS